MFSFLSLVVSVIQITGGVFAAWPIDSPLLVTTAPTTPKPYVLPHGQGFAFYFNGEVGRVIVANETSAGAFSVVVGNQGFTYPAAIHNHPHLMEALYVTKGSGNFFVNDQGRVLRQNDFNMLTSGNNHTYNFIDPDSEFLTCIQPGGIEKFLIALGAPYNSSTNSPYDPQLYYPVNGTLALQIGPQYDTDFQLTASSNNDFTNGTTADGLSTWHIANQTLPGSPVPYYISSNNGPKYLQRSLMQVIQPFATAKETNNRVTIGTIAMAKTKGTPATQSFSAHQVFVVLEGQLTITMAGSTVNLIPGDAAFVPQGTEFSYESCVAWTKFYAYAPSGTDCLVTSLLAGAESWGAPVFPSN
ncbi:MAG: hypothetical protein Q9227_004187 [Pyrenula ochraceoflavens]